MNKHTEEVLKGSAVNRRIMLVKYFEAKDYDMVDYLLYDLMENGYKIGRSKAYSEVGLNSKKEYCPFNQRECENSFKCGSCNVALAHEMSHYGK